MSEFCTCLADYLGKSKFCMFYWFVLYVTLPKYRFIFSSLHHLILFLPLGTSSLRHDKCQGVLIECVHGKFKLPSKRKNVPVDTEKTVKKSCIQCQLETFYDLPPNVCLGKKIDTLSQSLIS